MPYKNTAKVLKSVFDNERSGKRVEMSLLL